MAKLTIQQAAQRLDISADTIRRRVRRGQLAAERKQTPQGYQWIVTIPDDTRFKGELESRIELLQQALADARQSLHVVHEELFARRREVESLLALMATKSPSLTPPTKGAGPHRRLGHPKLELI
jgi:hypothetical protein